MNTMTIRLHAHSPTLAAVAVALAFTIPGHAAKPGADVDVRQRWFAAIAQGDVAAVEQLLAGNIDVDTQTPAGGTGLALACRMGRTDVVRKLIAAGADVNATAMKMTALHAAVQSGAVDAVEALLEAGARVTEPVGMPLVWYAVMHRNRDLLETLIDRGAPVDATYNGMSVVPFAVRMGTGLGRSLPGQKGRDEATKVLGTVRSLLRRGADVNGVGEHGMTALMYAAEAGWTDAVALLLDKGAKTDHHEGRKGRTALMLAVLADSADAVDLLLRAGAEPGAYDFYGATALFLARGRVGTDIAAQLERAGAELGLFSERRDAEVAAIVNRELRLVASAIKRWKHSGRSDGKDVPRWRDLAPGDRDVCPLWHRDGKDILGNRYVLVGKDGGSQPSPATVEALRPVTGEPLSYWHTKSGVAARASEAERMARAAAEEEKARRRAEAEAAAERVRQEREANRRIPAE